MASFFKNLFRKEDDSQPVPAAPLTNSGSIPVRMPLITQAGEGEMTRSQPLQEGQPSAVAASYATSSRHPMTARELATLLPAALLRYDAIGPDQAVPLPLGPLRESLQAGRPVLWLSQIHAACPELFQRAPLPEEEAEITFPLARVKGMLEFSAPMNPPSFPLSAAPAAAPTVSQPAANPFANLGSAMAPPANSPFAVAPVAAMAASHPAALSAGMGAALPPVKQGGMPFPMSLPSALPTGGGSPFSLPNAPSPFATALPVTPPVVAAPAQALTSPFAPVSPLPASATPSPFTVARAGESPLAAPATTGASPFTAYPSFPSTSGASLPSAPPQAVAFPAGPPSSAGFPNAAAATASPSALRPSPFAAVQAAPPNPLSPPAAFSPLAVGAASGAAPLTWPPPARASAGAPLPLSPPPRANPLPPSSLVSPLAAAPVLPAVAHQAASVHPLPAQASSPVLLTPPMLSALATAPVAVPMMDLSLRMVLRDVDPKQLGFVPDNVPESVRLSLPLNTVVEQLATGRVEISLETLCAGISEKFRPAFARATEALRISIPMSEVFHNLPESARPALAVAEPVEEHRSITTSPFQTPFAIKADEDANRQLLDLSLTGFNSTNLAARLATHPVPAAVLPPAPLPLVQQPAAGDPPSAQVDLPVLRPVASSTNLPFATFSTPLAATETGGLPTFLPRPGLLSRAPGSGTAPTQAPVLAPNSPKSPPRLKSAPTAPPSTSAQRPFLKPVAPVGYENGTSAPASIALPEVPPPIPVAPSSFPNEISPAALSPSFAPPPAEPTLPVVSPPASWSNAESTDDLGESFSAATLSTEPPPRAGSVPVAPPSLATASVIFPPLDSLVARPVAKSAPVPAWPSDLVSVPVADLVPSPSAWPTVVPNAPPAADTAAQSALGDQRFLIPDLASSELTDFSSAPVVAVPIPVAPVPATSPLEDLTFGCITDLRQLTLRAVLGTDQLLTAQDIVDRCASLPGLQACVLLQPNTTLTSQGMNPAAAAAFCFSAAKTRDSLAVLAETMGLGTGGNFTLRTDHGIRSFFLEPNLCLAVWHAQPQFSGGTREKLILTAHELAKSPLC